MYINIYIYTHMYMYTYVYMTRFIPTNPKAGWENVPYFQILSLRGYYVEGGLWSIINVNYLLTTIGFRQFILCVYIKQSSWYFFCYLQKYLSL